MDATLSKDQLFLYRQILDSQAKPLVEDIKQGGKFSYPHVFSILQSLKQVCNHPALLGKPEEYKKYSSGKFDLFKELISESLASGNKVVVFSQYVQMIKILSLYLAELGVSHVSMTGQTQNRGELIENFQNNDQTKVFLCSLLAGGIGIDLTSANVVIHYDRWWNASKENQATDRVHRIGQKRFVQVFKLITKGTLEEKIDAMISKKDVTFKKYLEQNETLFKTLSRQEMLELLQAPEEK
jgi:SNF2 family DNA or RNA helicase